MRVCADCHFRQQAHTCAKPAAALVLAFSSTRLHGEGGVVEQIREQARNKHMPMAAAYCVVCRQCTWLCSADMELNSACLDFMQLARSTAKIQSAAAVMHASNLNSL